MGVSQTKWTPTRTSLSREWSEDDPAMRKPVRAQRKRHKMKVDGASVKNMLRIIGDRARNIGGGGRGKS